MLPCHDITFPLGPVTIFVSNMLALFFVLLSLLADPLCIPLVGSTSQNHPSTGTGISSSNEDV